LTNSKYVRGRAYEYKVKRQLESEGWTVLRSAGSHGYFDLTAIKEPGAGAMKLGPGWPEGWKPCGEIKLIQTKTGKTKKRAIEKVVMSKLAERFEGLYSVSVEVV
jgi:hypothetical protein